MKLVKKYRNSGKTEPVYFGGELPETEVVLYPINVQNFPVYNQQGLIKGVHQKVKNVKDMPNLYMSQEGDSIFYTPNSEWVDEEGYEVQPNSPYFPNVNTTNQKQYEDNPDVFQQTVTRWNKAKKYKGQ